MGLPGPLAKWTRKAERAEHEWGRREVDSWARTAEFGQPFSWGEAEAAVLARDYDRLPGSSVARMLGVVGWTAVVIAAIPLAGASLIGLVLVALGCNETGADAAQDWFSLATTAFVVATVAAVVAFTIWWETRRRSVALLIINALNLIGSAAAYTVLAVSTATAESWLPVLMLASGLVSAATLGLGLFSKPEGRTNNRRKSLKPPRRGPRGDKRARALRARKRLLEVVVHRGLVKLDEADLIRVGEFPLGYWSELDGLDEREWRRVLERRHTGWRDFTSEP
ncbi:hypothetical protein [Glycomyces artemisiae]|uniref:Uncharacterized protein n=1 Tax=Glycomyces artemisiae TaxID=1076443 RepID=A0A2T0USZ4_9ACTN|nr:hypothetical protein [Glycomyces artemisiae]PRY60967.1 hypothetical protein B0I28_102582 [Glycomyces artemisiae]